MKKCIPTGTGTRRWFPSETLFLALSDKWFWENWRPTMVLGNLASDNQESPWILSFVTATIFWTTSTCSSGRLM